MLIFLLYLKLKPMLIFYYHKTWIRLLSEVFNEYRYYTMQVFQKRT
jgi:hypothetical protein